MKKWMIAALILCCVFSGCSMLPAKDMTDVPFEEIEAYRAEHAEEIAAQEQALAEKRAAKQAYAEKQARKHAILQEARAARKAAEAAQTELHGDVFADAEKLVRTTEEGTA